MKPNLKKILSTDYKTMQAYIMAIVFICIPLLENYLGLVSMFTDSQVSDDRLTLAEFLVLFCPIAALAATGYCLVRVAMIYFSMSRSIVVDGFVREVPNFGMGLLEYGFDLEGKSYQAENLVRITPEVKTLEAGQQVEVIVNPRNPRKAFLKQLYIG